MNCGHQERSKSHQMTISDWIHCGLMYFIVLMNLKTDFISDTGVEKMRAAAAESDANKTIKQRMRERVRPKLGRVELDYQVLHDAFFRHQTKPKMTVHGDMYVDSHSGTCWGSGQPAGFTLQASQLTHRHMQSQITCLKLTRRITHVINLVSAASCPVIVYHRYFEGKEYEVRYESKTPGNISDKLKVALGMQVGAPPPWLINMQRYGPPPSYPRMKIAGLNAPIPEGASYGFHPGGWGKPPVDEYGRPLYGDVFGTDVNTNLMGGPEVEVDRKHWGEIEESESEEESEEEEEEAAQMEDDMDMDTEQAGATTGMGGTETPMDGVTSTISGMETPEVMQLRKGQKGGAESVDTPVSSELYQVLEQQETSSRGQLMGSSYKYVMPTAGRKASAATGVEISLDPSEVGNLDKDVLAVKYQDQVEVRQCTHLKLGRGWAGGPITFVGVVCVSMWSMWIMAASPISATVCRRCGPPWVCRALFSPSPLQRDNAFFVAVWPRGEVNALSSSSLTA